MNIIKRMEEIRRMWSVVNFLKKSESQLIYWRFQKEASIGYKKFRDRRFRETNKALERKMEPEEQEVVESGFADYENFLTFRKSAQHSGRGLVERETFVDEFIGTKYSNLIKNHERLSNSEKLNNTEVSCKLIEVNQWLDNCIEPENAFIRADDNNQGLIYLTIKGRKFGGIDGLIKAIGIEVTQIVGAWNLVAIAVISTATVVRFDLVLQFAEYIYHLVVK